ncbi:uncharacterized protein [Hyperolius riggenbachi]|uniref:uncharacterized protein n=1 Tax=Hyperolius riggenbachi TaxID=752182 RepID=UPI0035A35D83
MIDSSASRRRSKDDLRVGLCTVRGDRDIGGEWSRQCGTVGCKGLEKAPGADAMVVIQYPPTIHVTVGGNATMYCDFTSASEVNIEQHYWTFNELNDSLGNTSIRTVTPTSLVISSVTANDTGNYTCVKLASSFEKSKGNGTYVTVTEGGTSINSFTNYNPYALMGLIPLLLAFLLCLIRMARRGVEADCTGFRFLPAGCQTSSAERRAGRTYEEEDMELQYATIAHRPAGEQKRKERSRERADDVEYAPVRRAAPDRSATSGQKNADPENLCYATLTMSLPNTRPLQQPATLSDCVYSQVASQRS